jgi:hypothetical protein
MHDLIRMAIGMDDTETIELIFPHTKTKCAVHRSDIPMLIGALQNLDRTPFAPETPCIDLSSQICGYDKNASLFSQLRRLIARIVRLSGT